MFPRRRYRSVRPSARPPVQPNDSEQPYEPRPLYDSLREGYEERFTQRLHELARTPAQFPELLDELLQNEGWMEDIQYLPQRKLVEVIDYLHDVGSIPMPSKSCSSSLQILDGLDRTGSQFREGLHLLRELCGSWAVLPATYLVSGKLSFSTMVRTINGYKEIYTGSLGDADVCIKKLPLTFWNVPAQIQRVSRPHSLWLDRHALTSFEGTL